MLRKDMAMRRIQASILAIGTEITMGQILNSNAQKISETLSQIGIEVLIHLTVPDERQLMLDAIDFASKRTEIIFITGGLGPTSDDFTREIIAQYLHKELVWDESSWIKIQKRFQELGRPVRDIQKQQCYFPMSSEILVNTAGTANGFYIHQNPNHYFILPGPPKEIDAIWKLGVEPRLQKNLKDLDALRTHIWTTEGAGESEIATLIYAAIGKSCPFTVAFRVHLPYVEVKLSYLESQKNEAQGYIQKIDDALSSHIRL